MARSQTVSRGDGSWFEPADDSALADLSQAYDELVPEVRRASVIDPESTRALLGDAVRSYDFGPYEASLRGQARRCAEVGLGLETLEAGFARLAGDLGPHLVRRYARVPRRLLAVFDAMGRLLARELSVLGAEYGSAQTTAHPGDGVIATDERGAVIRMNPAAERLVGWTFAEAAGRPLAEVFRLEGHDTGVEVAEVLRGGRSLGLPKHPILVARNGSPGCSVSESMAPIHADDGTIRGVIVVFRDQHVEVAHNQALEASQAQMMAIIEASLDGLITVDEGGRVSEFNGAAERMFGYDRDDVVGVPFVDIIVPQPPGEESSSDDPRPLGRRSERLAMRADGSMFPVEVAIARIRAGGAAEFICFVRDLTTAKQGEAALRHSKQQLRALAGRVEAAREDERSRIARELHDELGQQLAALRMDLGWLGHRLRSASPEVVERVAAMCAVVDSTFVMIRRIATELRPRLLDDLGLVAAIEWQAREFEGRSGIRVQVQAGPDLPSIDPRCATAIFRIFQEILTNVGRHSGAGRVRARLTDVGGGLRLDVTDDGRSIREEEVANFDSLGLLGMRERAALLDGTFLIGPSARGGTLVSVTLPNRVRP